MSTPESEMPAGLHVGSLMLHDLVNHFTVALGHNDLLLLEIENGASCGPQSPRSETPVTVPWTWSSNFKNSCG